MRFPLVGAAVLLVVRAALAQTVVVGGIPSGVAGTFPGAGPQTIVDLAHPANRDGDLTTASLLWSANVPSPASCTAAVKIKILRRGLGTFSVVAERGPFAVQPGYGTVALTPPIAVRAGDLLAVVQLLDTATCGGVGAAAAGPREVVLRYIATDLASGSFASNGLLLSGAALMVRASSDAEAPAAFLPVVGSAAGVNTFFRTSAQAFNPSTQLIKGKYVFHPAGRAGVASDPSMNYVYAAGSATSIPDVLAAMGQSGLGSLDVVPSSGVPPRVIAHI